MAQLDRGQATRGVCPICGFWTENLQDHLEDMPESDYTDEDKERDDGP